MPTSPDAERRRLVEDPEAWRRWGPYLSERSWGTVREDYSANGDAWEYFPHDHARSRAYRWSEDGMGGICDESQRLCLAFAFWNGRDPILKERVFGLTGPEGNHGEDAKEYWFYLDSTPTHSWMVWRYLYPQGPFPYEELIRVNGARTRLDPEYELLDTGAFDEDRYWELTATYAKADADDICVELTVRNCGPEQATIDVLPTLWFRNTWAWEQGHAAPSLSWRDGVVVASHRGLGEWELVGSGEPEPLFCDNETNIARLFGAAASQGPAYPKDAINDFVVSGTPSVNPERCGTKASLRYRLSIEAGQQQSLRLRLRRSPAPVSDAPASDHVASDHVASNHVASNHVDAQEALAKGWEDVMATRRAEADDFYRDLAPTGAGDDHRLVLRQACAGMMWSKEFFHYDVDRWLDGDPTMPPALPQRREGRNVGWRHFDAHEVISMPDPWEYPWFAAWDLAFHCVTLAHLDPAFAKDQLLLLCREWYMHPNGQLPAYEWKFEDVNPPVHAWAALRVFDIDGRKDYDFLERVLHKLMINFTWWVNRKDADGSNVFEGGFLGLDNIGPIDRSAALPVAGRLEQSDGTAWMAMYCLSLLEMSLVLATRDPTYEDIATKFFEHFTYIACALNDQGLWDEEDGFYYDLLRLDDGTGIPLRVRSMVGLVPIFAVTTIDRATLERLPGFAARLRWFLEHKTRYSMVVAHLDEPGEEDSLCLSVLSPARLRRVLSVMLAEDEFLSPHGLRSLSACHREQPFRIDVGDLHGQVDYEPAESTTALFGGNSNWRGPVWFPLNFLVTEALTRFHRYLGPSFAVQLPTGSDQEVDLAGAAMELSRRLVGIFLEDAEGRRPVFGGTERFQNDPRWHGLVPFHEYFHGDNGAGLGASHQTGWTGLVVDLLLRWGEPVLTGARLPDASSTE